MTIIHRECVPDPAAVTVGTRAHAGANVGVIMLAFAVVALWGFSLSRSLFDPMGYDQALYQYMTERVMLGDRLYVDVWDQNGPGIIAIHWLCTLLIGREPVSLRIFDAGWQLLTLFALFALAVRDGRRYRAGWIACGLYILAYYTMGYVQTAQREGFAALPIVLMIHLLAGATSWRFARGFFIGVLGLFVFAIKPPLGLCFGAMWVYTVLLVWRQHRSSSSHPPIGPIGNAWMVTAGMTVGFLVASVTSAALVAQVGSLQALLNTLLRRDIPGYVQGPRLVQQALPTLFVGAGIAWLLTTGIWRRRYARSSHERTRLTMAALVISGLLLTAQMWPGWQLILIRFAGLWIPAMGAVQITFWRERSDIRLLSLLMLLTTSTVLILQGQFFLYHLPPVLVLAAFVAGMEITERWAELHKTDAAQGIWLAVCVGAAISLAVGPWWSTMTLPTRQPYVLAGTTLEDHYTSITKHKLSCPTYTTTIKTTRRIQELTGPNDPIGLLFHEARIYYFARRPTVYKLMAMQVVYSHMFADYMQAIRNRRPKVLIARIPESLRQSDDLQAVQAAVFDQVEGFFGPSGVAVRELYQVTERINDLCILQPR